MPGGIHRSALTSVCWLHAPRRCFLEKVQKSNMLDAYGVGAAIGDPFCLCLPSCFLQRKVPKGRHGESSEHDAASEGGSRHCLKENSNGPCQQEGASVGGVDSLNNGTVATEGKLENSSEDILGSNDDEDSLESNVGSDLLTNVEGQVDLLHSRPKLTGVKIVEDDETENVGMKNVARLLRRQRYHDDDISQPAAAPRIRMSRSANSSLRTCCGLAVLLVMA